MQTQKNSRYAVDTEGMVIKMGGIRINLTNLYKIETFLFYF